MNACELASTKVARCIDDLINEFEISPVWVTRKGILGAKDERRQNGRQSFQRGLGVCNG